MATDPVATAVGAIVGELVGRAGVDGWRRFVALPPFLFPLERTDFDITVAAVAARPPPDATSAEAIELIRLERAAQVAWLANPIVEPDAVLHRRGRSLSDVLAPVARAATAPDALAARFRAMEARITTMTRTVGGLQVTEVGIPPPSDVHDDRAWVSIAMSASSIAARVDALPEPLAAWVARQDRLASSFSLREVRFDLMIVEVVRSWLDRDTLVAPGWTWSGPALSDGGAPPRGSMPAYVVALALIRRAVLVVEGAAGGGATFSAKPGGGGGGGGGGTGPTDVARRAVLTGAAVRAEARAAIAREQRGEAPPQRPADGELAAKPGQQIGSIDVPFAWSRIEAPELVANLAAQVEATRAALAGAQAAQTAAQDAHVRVTGELSALEDEIAAAREALRSLESEGGVEVGDEVPPPLEDRGGGGRPRPRPPRVPVVLARARARLRELEGRRPALATALDAASAAIQPASQQVADRRAAHDAAVAAEVDWGRFSTGDDSPDALYVLGYICESLPRCPTG